MKEEVAFELGSFYANAGILGLIRMLEYDHKKSEGKYRFVGPVLYVDKEYLLDTDLTELFMQTLINEEQNTGKYPKFVNKLKELYEILRTRSLEKKEQNTLERLLDDEVGLSSKSYKGAYQMLKDKNHYTIDLYDLIDDLKNEKDLKSEENLLSEIIAILEDDEVSKYLFFRELAYNRIQIFWDSVSFLNRNDSKKDMKEVHYKKFEKPLKEYLSCALKKTICCEECGELISDKEKCNYSYLKGTTADIKRKTNDFWNYKVNSWVCPKCNFLFSLMPLGFSRYQSTFLFVNINQDVQRLKNVNASDIKKSEDDWKKQNQDKLLNLIDKESSSLKNIEVIEAGVYDNRYLIHLIRKESLEIMKDNEKNLVSLLSMPRIRINNEYINLYKEVMSNILNLKDNYLLIYRVLKEQIYSNMSVYPAWLILKIQFNISLKRKESDHMLTEKDIDSMNFLGQQLQQAIFESKKTDDRKVLHSLSYKLLNAVRIGDIDTFCNIVLRTCASYDAPVPVLLMKAIKNHENFADLANAYLIGLEYTKKDNSSQNEEKKEGVNI